MHGRGECFLLCFQVHGSKTWDQSCAGCKPDQIGCTTCMSLPTPLVYTHFESQRRGSQSQSLHNTRMSSHSSNNTQLSIGLQTLSKRLGTQHLRSSCAYFAVTQLHLAVAIYIAVSAVTEVVSEKTPVFSETTRSS